MPNPISATIDYHAGSDGIIMGRHHPSLVKIGDFINVIASIKKS
jgi:predicted deacylase